MLPALYRSIGSSQAGWTEGQLGLTGLLLQNTHSRTLFTCSRELTHSLSGSSTPTSGEVRDLSKGRSQVQWTNRHLSSTGAKGRAPGTSAARRAVAPRQEHAQHRVWETQDTRLKLCNRVLGFLSSWAKDAFLNGPSAGNWVVGGHHS